MKLVEFYECSKLGARVAIGSVPVIQVAEMIRRLTHALDDGKQIFICGNGGSFSTAQHFSCELGKLASLGKKQRFKVTCLGSDQSWLTALGNDEGYQHIFSQQLANFAQSRDVLIVLSGSGKSPNILEAVSFARDRGMYIIGLSGKTGPLKDRVNLSVVAKSTKQEQIEIAHFFIMHVVSYWLAKENE